MLKETTFRSANAAPLDSTTHHSYHPCSLYRRSLRLLLASPLFLFVFVIAQLGSSLSGVAADLVILNVKKSTSNSFLAESSRSNNGVEEILKVCATRRDMQSTKDGTNYDLIYLNNTDGCRSSSAMSSINEKAAFLRIGSSPSCQFTSIALNLQLNNPNLVIIGSNGPLVNYFSISLSLFI
jgi:hypothetical protein